MTSAADSVSVWGEGPDLAAGHILPSIYVPGLKLGGMSQEYLVTTTIAGELSRGLRGESGAGQVPRLMRQESESVGRHPQNGCECRRDVEELR